MIDRGWSLADTLTQVDEGSAGGPALPGGAAGQKALAAQRRRLKDSYSLVVVHELDEDYKLHLKQNFFQDGPGAFAYLQGELRQPPDRLKIRQLDKDWNNLDLLQDVGVSANITPLVAQPKEKDSIPAILSAPRFPSKVPERRMSESALLAGTLVYQPGSQWDQQTHGSRTGGST